MRRETFDVTGASAQQEFYRSGSRVADIEPDDLRRSAAQYAKRYKILVSGHQDEFAGASRAPHRMVAGAPLS